MLFFKSAVALVLAGSAFAAATSGAAQTDVSFGRTAAQNGVSALDVTSTWTKYLKTGNATGACGVPYTDKSHGACVQSSTNCGRKIYAYLGNGTAPVYQSHLTVVDTCSELGPTGLYVTLDAFKELGGTVAAGEIHNVNWKYL